MKKTSIFLVVVLGVFAFMARCTRAASFTNLYVFSNDAFDSHSQLTNADGIGPDGLVVSGNVIYGIASAGGLHGYGTVFRMNTDGSNFTNLFNFDSTNGNTPNFGLVLVGNTLYGTTHTGGPSGAGNIFKINTDGSGFVDIHDFNFTDGQEPQHGLTLHSNLLYGTTVLGGLHGWGNIFTVDLTNNNVSFLYQFTNEALAYGGFAFSGDTAYAFARGPLGSNGWIYTFGSAGYSIVYNFTGTNGSDPWGTPIISGDTLFGATPSGGQFMNGNVFRINLDGSNFTNLYSFTPNGGANTDGSLPYSYTGLVLSGNTLYDTAASSGSGGQGTVFQVNTDGAGFAVLHSFGYADGADPQSLVLSGGKLYGGTFGGLQGLFTGNGGVFAITVQPTLGANSVGNRAILTWDDPTFSLTTSTNIASTFTNVPGASSPYTNSLTGPERFFRLQSN
jgi:uncharacterized repeat protein (TIGR03803 family)